LKEKDLVDQVLREELVARLEVEANSQELLKMLEYAAKPSSPAVKKALGEFGKKAEKQKEARRKGLLDELKRKGISGSAVLPNLDADPEWAEARSELKSQLQGAIREQLKSLPPSL